MHKENVLVYGQSLIVCTVCERIVRLVPIRFMNILREPNFELGHLVTKILSDNEFFLCSMCATLISFSALALNDFIGKFICFVCHSRDLGCFAYLQNYENPLLKQTSHLLYYKKYLHRRCLWMVENVTVIYNLLESNKWSQIQTIEGYEMITSSVCAPMMFPLSVPRPIDHIPPEDKPIKIYIDIEKIENLFANLNIHIDYSC